MRADDRHQAGTWDETSMLTVHPHGSVIIGVGAGLSPQNPASSLGPIIRVFTLFNSFLRHMGSNPMIHHESYGNLPTHMFISDAKCTLSLHFVDPFKG